MLTIIDDFSHKVWVFFLKHKSDVLSTLNDWKTMIEKQKGRQVKCLRTDNELEFCSNEFNTLYNKEGVAERMNKTLMEKCMLSNAQLPKSF